jgi:hypothetical protein
LGILLDYAAAVIKASDIRAAGAAGAIRYVSDRRPGGQWMLGKPIQLPEARDLYHNGLKIVSCYQYGKQDTADWLGGQTAGVAHAKRGWELHIAVLLAAQLGIAEGFHAPRRASAPGGDRQAQCGRCRRGSQPCTGAPIRTVGLSSQTRKVTDA